MSRDGLTLIELVVALTISGLALTMGYAGFSTVMDNQERAEGAMDEMARASAIRQSLTAWLGGARLTNDPGGPRFRGLDGVHRDLDDDELWFLTTAATPLGVGEFLVRIAVDRDEETPERGLVASFAEWRGVSTAQIVIDSTIHGIEIRYLSSVLGRRHWLPSWVSSTVLPAAVELRLSGSVRDTLHPLIEFPVLVALRGGT